MRAADTMIVWTPNRDSWADRPNGGKIEVTTIPEPPALREHPMSVGACDHDWRETDDAGRLALMQRYFSQMIHRDGMNEQTVRAALAKVDEFRDYPFSSDQIPDGDD